MKQRTILLVGGAGYVGTVLTVYLLNQGYRVICLDLLIYQNNLCITSFLSNPNYRFIYGDFQDSQILDQALTGVTDVVLLVGLVGDDITKKYPAESQAINTTGLITCIDRLNNRKIDRVIFLSSCSNYGYVKDTIASELFPLSPTSSYAQSKITIEQYLYTLKGQVDYKPTILRFATAFGLSPRLRLDLTINQFTFAAFRDLEITVFNPSAWRPYCHVTDFARVIDMVLTAPTYKVAFETFNAGGNVNNYTKQAIVDAVTAILPNAKFKYQNTSVDPRNYRIDFSKIKNTLGFEPTFTVEEGIKEIVEAMRNHVYDDAEVASNLYGNYELNYDIFQK